MAHLNAIRFFQATAIILNLLLAHPDTSSGQQARISNDEKILQLLKIVNGGYFKGAAPPPDNGTANIVKFNILIVRISGLDIVKQEISLDLWFVMDWLDARLAWNDTSDTSLAAVDEVFVPIDMLWIPDVTLNHPVDIRIFDKDKFLASVTSTGAVHIEMPYGLVSKCPVKLGDFPFDSQQCEINFSSTVKKQKFLQLELGGPPRVYYDELNSRDNEFCTTNISLTVEKFSITFPEFKKILLQVKFQRRPLYYVTVLIIPSALILVTCIFGFLIPPDSGDRLALNVAILLSMSVFLQLAGSITPAQSESVPVLTWYFTVAMAVTALSTVGSIIVLMCYRRAASEQPVSNRALRLLFLNRLCGWAQGEDHCNEWRHIGRVLDWLLVTVAICLTVAVALCLIGSAMKGGFSAC